MNHCLYIDKALDSARCQDIFFFFVSPKDLFVLSNSFPFADYLFQWQAKGHGVHTSLALTNWATALVKKGKNVCIQTI